MKKNRRKDEGKEIDETEGKMKKEEDERRREKKEYVSVLIYLNAPLSWYSGLYTCVRLLGG